MYRLNMEPVLEDTRPRRKLIQIFQAFAIGNDAPSIEDFTTAS